MHRCTKAIMLLGFISVLRHEIVDGEWRFNEDYYWCGYYNSIVNADTIYLWR